MSIWNQPDNFLPDSIHSTRRYKAVLGREKTSGFLLSAASCVLQDQLAQQDVPTAARVARLLWEGPTAFCLRLQPSL